MKNQKNGDLTFYANNHLHKKQVDDNEGQHREKISKINFSDVIYRSYTM